MGLRAMGPFVKNGLVDQGSLVCGSLRVVLLKPT